MYIKWTNKQIQQYINVLKKHIRCFGGSSISADDDQNYDIRIFPTLKQATTVALPSMAYDRAGFLPNQNLFHNTACVFVN